MQFSNLQIEHNLSYVSVRSCPTHDFSCLIRFKVDGLNSSTRGLPFFKLSVTETSYHPLFSSRFL